MFAKKDRYRTGEHALNKKEYQKLISVVDHLEDEVMIKLAISTGIRREDLCHGTMKRKRIDKSTKKAVEYVVITGIKVSDIDFDEKKLSFLASPCSWAAKAEHRGITVSDKEPSLNATFAR